MTSQIHLSESDWTELATGACVISARGAADITFAAAQPPADAPAHGLISTSDPLEYTGPDKAWGRTREPGSYVVVSGAVVQPDLGPVQAVAPVVTSPPVLTPSAPDVGEDVTVDPGTATGTPAPNAEIELSVAGIRVATDVNPIRFPRPGAWELKVTWRNGTAPNAIAAVTGTVTAPAAAPAPGGSLLGGVAIAGLTDLERFGIAGAPFPSGPAFMIGDSIARNNQSQVMRYEFVNNGNGYSAFTVLGYAPADDSIPVGAWPETADSFVAGQISNMGWGGNTSPSIATRFMGSQPADVNQQGGPVHSPADRAGITIGIAGQNNYNKPTIPDAFEQLKTDWTTIITNADPAKVVMMPFQANLPTLQTTDAYGILSWARRTHGIRTFNWHRSMRRVAHRINGDGDATARQTWMDGNVPTAFMSSPQPASALDPIHPGALFSEAVSYDIARLVSALSPGGAPMLEDAAVPVDWSVPAGTKICDLDIIGTAQEVVIANDGGAPDAVTCQNGALYRGTGAAPATPWHPIYVAVANAAGMGGAEILLGRRTGTTRFGSGGGRVYGRNDVATPQGTISLVLKQDVNTATRFLTLGGSEIQLRGNGTVWFKFPEFSANVITGGSAATWLHVLLSWDGTTTYTSVNGAEVDQSANTTGAIDLIGGIRMLGGSPGVTPADVADIEHIWVSPEFIPRGSDLSALADPATHRSNITESAYRFSAAEPLIAMAGGPGIFGSGRNFATNGLGNLDVFPEWSAADAQIR